MTDYKPSSVNSFPAVDAINVVINYDKNRDVSQNKWSIPSDCNRVKIVNEARPRATFASSTLNPTIYDTGTEYISVGTGTQTINLPTPVQGTEFTVTHIAKHPLIINGQFLTGNNLAAMSQCSVTTTANVGQSIRLVAYSNTAWRVEYAQGAFTFT